MEKCLCMPLGAYQTNCYFVWEEGSKSCLIIDPGYNPEVITARLEEMGLSLGAILLTHGHFDHVGAVKALVAQEDCPVYLHPADTAMPEQMTAGKLYYSHPLQEGQTLSLCNLTVSVLHTPGHTPGSVCFAIGKHLFTGDTLFAGSCGRVDLPGGSWDALQQSLSRLKGLGQDCLVLPGHGEASTLGEEIRYNPYLRG